MQEAIPDEEAPSAHWYSHDCTGCRFQILHGCFMSFSFLILLRDPIDRPVYLGWHQTHKVLLGGGTKHRKTIFAESEWAPMAARASFDCVALRAMFNENFGFQDHVPRGLSYNPLQETCWRPHPSCSGETSTCVRDLISCKTISV